MNRRCFSLSAIAAAAAQRVWCKPAALPFSALGACASLTDAEAIKAAGGQYIEENVQKFLVPNKPDSEWLANLERAKACPLPILSCNSFLPGSLRCTGSDADHDAVLRYAETAFRRGQQAGLKVIVFGSSGSRSLREGFPSAKAEEQFVALLKQMGPLASASGITIAVEPLRRQECNFINTVLEGAAIVEGASHPNIRLLFDCYHMLQNGEDPGDLEKVGHLLVHGHIAEKENRSAPGVAGDDFRPFFSALAQTGYNGCLSIEGKWTLDELPRAFAEIRRQAFPA